MKHPTYNDNECLEGLIGMLTILAFGFVYEMTGSAFASIVLVICIWVAIFMFANRREITKDMAETENKDESDQDRNGP